VPLHDGVISTRESSQPAPVTLQGGLSSAEARARRARFGPNLIVERKRFGPLVKLLRMIADPMALMLAGAALLYLLLGKPQESALLAAVIVPVLGVDVLMEARSRTALKKLAAVVAPRAHVLRDGKTVEVSTTDLVPGDLLLFREGDVLHADGIVRSAANLALDESQLTGEAEPQDKLASMSALESAADESRFFAGSTVLAGHGAGEVTSTGKATRFGNIARLVGEAELESTPLQVKTARVARWLVAIALGLALAVFILRMLSGARPGDALLYAVSLGMSAVCEEVALVMSLFLALAAARLSRQGVLVRRLASVETLGSTTVICSDKTGTLTTGRFALEVHRALDGERFGDPALLEAAALACEPGAADSLEREILSHCVEHGVDPAELYARWSLAYDYPFDALGKHMSHVWASRPRGDAPPSRIVAKGALEGILEHCTLSPEERERAIAMNSDLANRGMRVIAVAGRFAAADGREGDSAAHGRSGTGTFHGVREDDERDLVLYGFLGFRDPIRPEVPAAVAECQSAGVRLKIITGDHALTAHVVAEAAGIMHDDSLILNGADLASMDQESAAQIARRASIFARVQPEQKYQIIDALVRAGEVVAMVGDGINDAPALRRAHIGVSMGRRGTEVARAAADIVLLEDNFAALVNTVREGRRVFGNIQHALRYLIGFKGALVGLALLAPALGLPILLLPVIVVWLELIVHPVSALAFEGEPGSGDIMKRPPRDPRAALVGRAQAARSAISGLLLAGVTMAEFAISLNRGEPYARATAMAVLIPGTLFLMWAELAGDRAWWKTRIPLRMAFWAFSIIVAASLPVFVTVPAIAGFLEITSISAHDWAVAAALSVVPVLWRVAGFSGGPAGLAGLSRT